ncbi:hypothetical protein ACG33_02025 [Steroidobacter denitrificans]|uniref:Response regulatory domain-containing protein n=1 Tax=Steroidobacter denitrificans TaxID=465721 RepID=A0A127F636_STEDE|nr:response regulator [Steroidobacter denitrificans]AMN45906.1 hypothetical protein ACG33_02025 [Steroidobacter denitrificans]
MIIDEDASMRETALSLLKAANIEAVAAADGEEALALSMRQWFPVLLTNRHIPVIDGIELVQRVRAIAIAPVYVIMLSADGTTTHEHEAGYCAGVDHYLPRHSLDAELIARVNTGFAAIRRRQSTATARGNGLMIIDLNSGAHTARHLIGRLHAEIALAARRRTPLTVISACIESDASPGGTLSGQTAASAALLTAVRGSIRAGLHWVARLPAVLNLYRLAIVLPESDAAEVMAVTQGIRNAFAPSQGAGASGAMQLSIGSVVLAHDGNAPTALELLGESERRRRGVGERTADEIQHVQSEAVRDTTEAQAGETAIRLE